MHTVSILTVQSIILHSIRVVFLPFQSLAVQWTQLWLTLWPVAVFLCSSFPQHSSLVISPRLLLSVIISARVSSIRSSRSPPRVSPFYRPQRQTQPAHASSPPLLRAAASAIAKLSFSILPLKSVEVRDNGSSPAKRNLSPGLTQRAVESSL